MGAKLLKKMGWKMGQGIGPRINYQQRKFQDEQSGHLPPPEDPEATKHTYAPRDTKLKSFAAKENFHGIGYLPGKTLEESLSNQGGGKGSGPTLSGKQSQFGV